MKVGLYVPVLSLVSCVYVHPTTSKSNPVTYHQEAAQASQEVPEREGSVSSVTTASVTTAIHVPAGEGLDHAPVLKSSSESLRQISLQLSGLVMGGEAAGKDKKLSFFLYNFKGESTCVFILSFLHSPSGEFKRLWPGFSYIWRLTHH